MITEAIAQAMYMMINVCDDPAMQCGMECMRDMLCDFDEDVWWGCTEEECKEFVKRYLEE